MDAVLLAVAVFLAVLLAVAIALLVIPIDVRARLAAEAALSWVVQVRWLFGLVRVERNSASAASAVHPPAERAAQEAEGIVPVIRPSALPGKSAGAAAADRRPSSSSRPFGDGPFDCCVRLSAA